MDDIKIHSKFADKNGEVMIVGLEGHVDQSNSQTLQKTLNDIVESGVFKVIFDCDQLYYMSSAGWGIFVGEVKRFRENGGDIKIANMNPDINDVFQMLEFFHILEDYSSVQEAALSFKELGKSSDLVIDIDGIEPVIEEMDNESSKTPLPEEMEDIEDVEAEYVPKTNVTLIDFIPQARTIPEVVPEVAKSLKQDQKLSQLPTSEKIKKIIAESPLIGPFGIKKVLAHQHFGNTKIGIFKLIKILKELDLNSKAKRYRYYRSC